jgi:hypothetical protein
MTQYDRPGELDDIEAASRFLLLGANAIAALGNLNQPNRICADEELNLVRRSELAALFNFFGEALRDAGERAEQGADRLDSRLRAMHQERSALDRLADHIATNVAAKHPEYAAAGACQGDAAPCVGVQA